MPIRRFSVGDWLDSPLSRRRLDLSELREQRATVEEIVGRVATEGDAALRQYGLRFDGWAPAPEDGFEVPRRELDGALNRLRNEDRAALELAASRIREFHEAQRYEAVAGARGLRMLTKPVRRAGLYVPGGRAAYPSTVLMTAIPARVAGVPEVVLCTPPSPDGGVPAAILAAAAIAGVDAVYRAGGAQAIAAMAYGTRSIPRVDFIAGPGNVYVTLAKKEVFGVVGVDAIAGPTEILVIADRTARADLVAADLASQMEHDPMAWAVLLTDSPALADAVEEEFTSLLERLERAQVIEAAHLAVVLVESMDQAVQVSNDFGPEHLEILVDDPARLLPSVENAGAIFLGPMAPVSLGDYVIGPNHTLPTSGSARFSSPLGVYSFLKRSSVSTISDGEYRSLAEAARVLARLEGLTAHANALEVRLGE